ncbi:hypothetical protein CERZMDRAFT_84464 [Cercospora zeae-maydis SCOH1-5]|uniref:Arrestin-like N-terminal domain-containing protein n=1 Tax=Cercospora zeae-maydis SCOH1-5 TaxID=717836 RepID=A0A6A6FHU5_9PEZI|nr:hypothetical protein CERZMDRAFT_84464 [Cercospora zeae-maydis SCOH1-5]
MSSKLGKLEGRVAIDGISQPHFGPQDTVTGQVTLVYLPYSHIFKKNVETASLFGPLRLNIILAGRIRLRIRRERSHALPTNHDATLFVTRFPVYSGSFEAEVSKEHTFTFKALFPQSLEPLPPSFSLLFHQVPDIVDIAVQYRLMADIDMPGIAIETIATPLEIKCDIARPSLTSIASSRTTFRLRTKVQNQHLLPSDQQPQGIKAKAKAIFTPTEQFPAFVLDIFCTDQKYAYPGQQMKFEVTLRRDDSETTAPAVPDITLDSFKADLKALTVVDGSQRLMGPPVITDKSYAQSLLCETPLPISFSKSNDYSTYVVTKCLRSHASSFRHPKLSRAYVLKITMQLTVAKKILKLSKDCPVTIVPAPSDDNEPPVAGSSRRVIGDVEDEVLPMYEEAPAYTAASNT